MIVRGTESCAHFAHYTQGGEHRLNSMKAKTPFVERNCSNLTAKDKGTTSDSLCVSAALGHYHHDPSRAELVSLPHLGLGIYAGLGGKPAVHSDPTAPHPAV